MKTSHLTLPGTLGFLLMLGAPDLRGQLIKNLQSFSNSVSVVDPAEGAPDVYEKDGPKEITTGDFDGDGNADLAVSKVFGRVAVSFGLGNKEFLPPVFLDPPASTGELRGIAAGDFNADGLPDVAVAAPFTGRVVIFHSASDRTFSAPIVLNAGGGVRNLVAVNLDGDGRCDLAVALAISSNGYVSTGAEVRPYYNLSSGWLLGAATPIPFTSGTTEEFPKPTIGFAALAPNPAGQQVAVTHGEANDILVLQARPSTDPGFVVVQQIPVLVPTHSLAAGSITSQNGPDDLVAAARDDNQILIRKGTANGFEEGVTQRLFIPGMPRASVLADVDSDGWNDLLVVLRDFDRVVTFHNDQGILKLVAEAPTGNSPRDIAVADFNGDGLLDAAVSNRDSDNISVLLTQPGGEGFERLDTVYAVDGGVSAMVLADVNGDGRADVIQSHLLTSEISVRLSQTGGLLGPAIYTKLDSSPVALRHGDFNGDGNADLIVVHSNGWAPGLSILTGFGDGTFAPPSFIPSNGSLFAIILADLDGDGIKDAVAGYYDCRLATYRGLADGTFEEGRIGLFNYESRAMAVGDFDQDGDLDIAGASAVGELTIVENDGHLLEPTDDYNTAYVRRIYAGGEKSRIKTMGLVETNGDGDPDIVINSEEGVTLYESGPGLQFLPQSGTLPGTKGASDLVTGDFDGDGKLDIVSACRLLSCVVILKGNADGSFAVAAVSPVPSADMIASGDIDGDGLTDLAGSGEVLWTALSGRASTPATGTMEAARHPVDSVVINEVLASNLSLRIEEADNKTPDVVELYNGRKTDVSLQDWTLAYRKSVEPGEPQPPLSTLDLTPAGTLPPGGRLLVICDGSGFGGHAPFKLAKEGGHLELLDDSNTTKDSVIYADQDPDISFGRYTDGSVVWGVKEDPDPGQPNYEPANGSGPRFRQVSMAPDTLRSDQWPRFLIKAADDVGIFTLSAIWKWRNAPEGTPSRRLSGRVGLYDDGNHGDEEPLDGLFAGKLLERMPAGAQIEFFLDGTNLVDQSRIYPGDPVFSLPGQRVTNYAFTITDREQAPGIEVSELQMHSAILSDTGEKSDFIEIRNIGVAPVDLTSVALRDGLFSTIRTKNLSGMLNPGHYAYYYADSEEGPLHLPFKLNKSGDTVWLVGVDANGVTTVLDSVDSSAETEGKLSWSRLGAGGPFAALAPTPGESNISSGTIHIERMPDAPARLRLGFLCPTGTVSILESLAPVPSGATWQNGGLWNGTGFEAAIEIPLPPGPSSRLFRIRR